MAAPTPVVVQGKVIGHAGADMEMQPQRPSISAAAANQAKRSDQQNSNLEVLELSCRDTSLPPEIRLGFVKKVYGILGVMLLTTFGLTVPFVFATDSTLKFFAAHTWILMIIGAIIIAQFVFDLAMSCQMCCGCSGLMESYLKMMKTAPLNYIYLMTFAACFGVLVGFACAQYTAQSVLLVFGLTAVLIVALTVYAVYTKADFTGCGAYVMVMILGLVMLLLVCSFFPGSKVMHKIVAGVGATLFGFIIVYDTQLIFGSATSSFNKAGERHLQYTIDMYAFAAWNLYLDFINFFLYMLQLFGDRRS